MVEIVLKRDHSPSPTREEPSLKKQSVGTPLEVQKDEQVNINDESIKQKKQKKRVIKYKQKSVDPMGPQGILKHEIKRLRESHSLSHDDILNDMHSILNDKTVFAAYNRVVENVNVEMLTSNGDGLAVVSNPMDDKKKQIVVIPFAIPGDIITIKIFRTTPTHAEADLVEVTTPSKDRNDELIKCGYFGTCAGCQYQMLPYDTQLQWKRETIVNAYAYLAKVLLAKGKIPEIGSTIPSPKQFSYRTKLTPHFDVMNKRRGGKIPLLNEAGEEIRPSFGFGAKNRKQWRKTGCITDGGSQPTLDIEECIIGTPIVNIGLKNERGKYLKEWQKYQKTVTVLLREHTRDFPKGKEVNMEVANEEDGSRDEAGNVSFIETTNDEVTLVKSCVTNSRQIVTEYINGFTFQFSAGEFFQNNNSILPKVTSYVCENLQIKNKPNGSPLYLVDAYCGSGLFSITASKGVDKVVGVDVSKESIRFATLNAERNGVTNVKFIDGKAEKIFNEIDTPNDLTSVIIDPSRKGCDDIFLNQLSDYKPAKVVYVSCNVHSQARDLEKFITGTENGHLYTIESIRGFDFFPQTHHVESVAVISRVCF